MQNEKRNNIYDTILTGLIALLMFGSIGNGAQPVRLAILCLAPFMLVEAYRRPHSGIGYYRYECFFLAFWWLMSAAFLYKSLEMAESVKHLVYLFIHILGFLEILWAALKANSPQRSVCRGWVILLLLTIPVAFWEITGGTHLWTTIMEDQSIGFGDVRIDRPYAAVTFGNLNSYNTIICWSMPYLCFMALFPEKRRDTFSALVAFLPILLIVVINSSRGAIICLGALILNYIRCYLKIGKHKTLMWSIVIVVTFILAYYLYEMFFFIIGRFTEQGMGDDGRTENIVKGTQAFLDSYGLGVGIGNYTPVMDRIYNVSIPAPHNLFLEIFVVNGIFVFVVFMGMLVRLFVMRCQGERRNKFFFSFACISLVLGGLVDSGYWMKAPTWMFLVSMYILVDRRYNKRQEPKPEIVTEEESLITKPE